MRALILAGGFGTRLSAVVKDVPKPMAPVAGRPFLEFVIGRLKTQGIKDIVLLTGHKSDAIEEHFGDGRNFGVSISYSVEREPLGTGGAIKLAAGAFPGDEDFIVLNGDTYFNADCRALMDFHRANKSLLTLSLKYMEDLSRYGSVSVTKDYRVEGFREKINAPSPSGGYINGGVMAMSGSALSHFRGSGILSIEKEVMPGLLETGRIFGLPFGGKFIDIGIPEDYGSAQEKLPAWEGPLAHGIKAAFLDRDGILNEDLGYMHKVSDLKIVEGVVPFLKSLKKMDYRFIIITNQAGIGKGIFGEQDYRVFQGELMKELSGRGIDILDSFFCPYHPEASIPEYRFESLLRKPEPGMVLAAADRHYIDVAQSVMIGDKDSDRIRLPYLRSYILRGRYGNDATHRVYSGFDEILEAIINDRRDN